MVTRFARTTNYNLNLRRCLRFKLLFFPLTAFGEKIGRLFSVYFAPCEKVILCAFYAVISRSKSFCLSIGALFIGMGIYLELEVSKDILESTSLDRNWMNSFAH